MSKAKESAVDPVMSTPDELIDKALGRYSPTDAEIARLRESFLAITVKGEEDRDGAASARAARLEVKSKRVGVEKMRVELKKGALEYGRAVDAKARGLREQLEEIESHLQTQEDIVALAVKRREAAEAAARAEELRRRMKALAEAESPAIPEDVARMGTAQFDALLAAAKGEQQSRAEAKRIEQARQAAEREELERRSREQAEEAKRLRDERAELDAERARLELEKDGQVAGPEPVTPEEKVAEPEQAEPPVAAEAASGPDPVAAFLVNLASAVNALEVIEFDGSGEVREILDRCADEILAVAFKVERSGVA